MARAATERTVRVDVLHDEAAGRPALVVERAQQRLRVEGVQAGLPSGATSERRVGRINTYLFHELGFNGNHSDYYDPRNSLINHVLERLGTGRDPAGLEGLEHGLPRADFDRCALEQCGEVRRGHGVAALDAVLGGVADQAEDGSDRDQRVGWSDDHDVRLVQRLVEVGRVVDRYGPHGTLVVTGTVQPLMLGLLLFAHPLQLPGAVIAAITMVAGAFSPPISVLTRTLWRHRSGLIAPSKARPRRADSCSAWAQAPT